MGDSRAVSLKQWLDSKFSNEISGFRLMNGDAGFRRYFRFYKDEQSFVAVDSPSDTCNNAAFILMQSKLGDAGILVPGLVAYEESQGFMCLTDLGENLLFDSLTDATMANWYQQAINLLPAISSLPTDGLPVYDRPFVQLELDIFNEWLLKEHLNITLSDSENIQLQQCFGVLIDNVIEQPQVVMHRDYHSRNLMVNDNKLAVIDFQDAVVGPVTYDIVSLLRDCYVKWPAEKITPLLDYYIQLINTSVVKNSYSPATWQRWFDLTGLQRHIKASGIFSRLFHRDEKPGYLADIPLTLSYITDVAQDYPELSFLHELVDNVVIPQLNSKERANK